MAITVYHNVDFDQVAEEMRADPEFGMQVLAHFMDIVDPDAFALEAVENQHHIDTAPKLRKLATAIETALELESKIDEALEGA